jgi:hypothetical protein
MRLGTDICFVWFEARWGSESSRFPAIFEQDPEAVRLALPGVEESADQHAISLLDNKIGRRGSDAATA